MTPILSILRLLAFVWLLFWLDHRYVPPVKGQWWVAPYAFTIGAYTIGVVLWTVGDLVKWIKEKDAEYNPSDDEPTEPMSHVCPKCRHQFVEVKHE